MVRDGETALLYPLGDADTCADQIQRILADSDLRRRMEKRCRQEARDRFHPDAVAEQTVRVYRAIQAR
jgi:glycosyltransferase involved in cell wall biosynthesis